MCGCRCGFRLHNTNTYMRRMAGEHYTLDEVLEMIEDDAEPMTYGSDEEFEDLMVEEVVVETMDMEDDDLGTAEDAEEVDNGAGPSGVGSAASPSAGNSVADDWTTDYSAVPVLEFLEDVGPTFNVGASVEETLGHLLPDAVLEDVVKQSNMYAQEVMEPEKFSAWIHITLQEFKAYIGFCILMGLVRLPEISDYWKTDPYFHYAPIADRISRRRFMEITRYLHFANNDGLMQRGEPGYDRLGKVRPVINSISQTLTSCYNIARDVVVDEAMIPFQGRSTMKQYLPKKPVKRGIKVWCLADSCNGYVQRFDVYTGQSGEDCGEKGLGAKVVKCLSSHLKGKRHHLYCDNYFSSPHLFLALHKDGIYACGTVRANCKGYPEDLKNLKGKRREREMGLKKR